MSFLDDTKEGQAAQHAADGPPPPYEASSNAGHLAPGVPPYQSSRPTSRGSSSGSLHYNPDVKVNPSASSSSSSSSAPCRFPANFSMYRSGVTISRHHLGESKDSPLYGVVVHSGFTKNKDVVLHSGVDGKSPPLAEIGLASLSADIRVTLPPSPGLEVAKCSGAMQQTWRFAIEVSSGGREEFEWRHSRSDAIKSLGGASSGFKLVRLARGDEVVMVHSNGRMSFTKMARFAFMGSGATGELGDRWAVMAVATALGIWETDQRRQAVAAAAG